MAEEEKTERDEIVSLDPSRDEIEQMGQLREEHPWQLRFGDFLKRVCDEYGHQLCEVEVLDPKGNLVKLSYLWSPDRLKLIHLPGTLGMDDQLDQFVTASLCRRLRIPPEHWGLLPEDPFEGDPDLSD